MKRRKLNALIGLVIVAAFFIAAVPANVEAELPGPPDPWEPPELPDPPEPTEPPEPSEPGWFVSGVGTYFEITDSSYLNVTLSSTETINVTLESVPSVISLTVEAVDDATSTEISMTGFEPGMTYYRHQDGDLQESFVADADGNYSYTQDLTTPHHMFVAEEVSTKRIWDDATGGDCTSIGTWDSSTKTCTLTTNVYEEIQIRSDYITLDGNGYTVSGSGTFGINVPYKYPYSRDITIKNVNVTGFAYGIYLYRADNSEVSGNTITNVGYGIRLYNTCGSSTVSGNTISQIGSYGIYLHYCYWSTVNENTISQANARGIYMYRSYWSTVSNNTITGGQYGIYLSYNWGTTVSGNTISQVTTRGMHMYYSGSGTTVSENSISGGTYGMYLDRSGGATVTGNTISQTISYHIFLYYSTSCTLSNNILTEGQGIYVRYSQMSTISGNEIYPASTSSYYVDYGIYISSSHTSTVSGNTISPTTSQIFYGIYIGSSHTSTVSGNTISSTTSSIHYNICISSSPMSTVTENDITSTSTTYVPYYGIWVTNSDSISVTYNAISDVSIAIYITHSTDVSITHNVIQLRQKSGLGIHMYQSQDSNIIENSIQGDREGIRLYYCTNIQVDKNTLSLGGIVIQGYNPMYWTSHDITPTNIIPSYGTVEYCKSTSGFPIPPGAGQVILADCENTIVENKNLVRVDVAYGSGNIIRSNSVLYIIWIFTSPGTTVSGNAINVPADQTAYIQLMYSSGSIISGNTVTGDRASIYVTGSPSSTVTDNTITLTRSIGSWSAAISLYSSDGSNVTSNTIVGEYTAVIMSNTIGATVSGNTMVGGGLLISGYDLTHFNSHTFDTTNMVAGKPILYCKDTSGGTIPAGAGQVIMANCNNMIVEDQDIRDVYQGITIVYGSGNTVRQNTFSNVTIGIFLSYSDDNIIARNIIDVNNQYSSRGIYATDSGNNIIFGNNIISHTWAGIDVRGESNTVNGNTILAPDNPSFFGIYISGYNSEGSVISGNFINNANYGLFTEFAPSSTIAGNRIDSSEWYAIGMMFCEGSTIFHNSIMEDINQEYYGDLTGTWNNQDYEGNYWAQYPGEDIDGDGIGDTHVPYNDVDHYPLMAPSSQAPEVLITAPQSGLVVPIDTTVTLSGSFTDANIYESHTATWNIDGTDLPGTLTESDGSGTIEDTYTFNAVGVYQISLTVTDNHGLSTTTDNIGDLKAFVVVFDPSEGFVTGGGWINSPQGAFPEDPTLTGKATFGFVSKYHKGAMVPEGQTEFHFKAADLNFHSDDYQWLVIAGAKAQYKGTGTINGEGSYGFKLIAIDGELLGSGEDKFRIKIWDLETEVIIYDNEIGEDDETDPTTVIAGGQIKIHKK